MDKTVVRSHIETIGQCKSLRSEHPNEYVFFYELFQKHPHAERKRVSEITDICIQKSWGEFRLGYILRDGTKDTISWNKCLSGKQDSPDMLLSRALRTAIMYQMKIYRRSQINCCVLCSSDTQITVDHYPVKFRHIRDEFLQTHAPPTIFTKNYRSQDCFREEDAEFEREWQEFHEQKASYRILCSTCNATEH
jgi:hypothetical protein